MSNILRRWYFIVTFYGFTFSDKQVLEEHTISLNVTEKCSSCAYAEVSNQVVTYVSRKYYFTKWKIEKIYLDKVEVI